MRALVLALMAVGAVLLLSPAPGAQALGAVPFLSLCIANQARFLASIDALLARRPILLTALPMLVLAGTLLARPPAASDDLLRHIAAAAWPDGYRGMYVHTVLPGVPLYPAFDALAASLSAAFGPAATMWLFQALAVGGFVWVFVAAARSVTVALPPDAASALGVLMLTVLLPCMGYRLLLGRPEVFLSIWALAACLPKSRSTAIVWTSLGLLLGSGYWLAPVYFPAALLLPRRVRWWCLTGLSLSWTAWWWWLTDGGFAGAFADVLLRTVQRVPGIQVAENASVIGLLAVPSMIALAIGALWALARPQADRRLLMLAAYFALSNQIRYVSLIAPLLALFLLSALARAELRWPARAGSATLLFAAVCFGAFGVSGPAYRDLPRFNLPDGAVVFTGFNEATYAMPFANPGRIRVAPGFDIGALDPDVQRQVVAIGEGRIDCDRLMALGFSHVVESTLTGDIPTCLQLLRTQGVWRLWALR